MLLTFLQQSRIIFHHGSPELKVIIHRSFIGFLSVCLVPLNVTEGKYLKYKSDLSLIEVKYINYGIMEIMGKM